MLKSSRGSAGLIFIEISCIVSFGSRTIYLVVPSARCINFSTSPNFSDSTRNLLFDLRPFLTADSSFLNVIYVNSSVKLFCKTLFLASVMIFYNFLRAFNIFLELADVSSPYFSLMAFDASAIWGRMVTNSSFRYSKMVSDCFTKSCSLLSSYFSIVTPFLLLFSGGAISKLT